MTENIKTEIANGVMTLTLSRVDKKNALTNAMYSAMSDELERAEKDPAVRVVLFQGDGDSLGQLAAALGRRRIRVSEIGRDRRGGANHRRTTSGSCQWCGAGFCPWLGVPPPSRPSECVIAFLEIAAGGFACSRCSCPGRGDGHLRNTRGNTLKISLLTHNRRSAYDNDS
jgi:hypothetical protein